MIGLVPFNDSATSIGVYAGSIPDSAIALTTPMTKTLSSWSAGSGSGGVDVGTIPASTWGHIFGIHNPSTGVSDVLISGSAYNPLLPAGFTEKQILNSFLVDGSGNIVPGEWLGDGRFILSEGIWPVQGERLALPPPAPHVSHLHLVPAGTPQGIKLRTDMRIVSYNTEAQNWGFYGLVLDPDAYPTRRLDGSRSMADYNAVAATATFDKVAGFNWSTRLDQSTDEMGQVFFGSQAGTANNFGHIYLQGWTHPREADQPTVSMAVIGASLTMDRNANNWLNVAARALEIGKSSRVKIMTAGKEGTASNYWISNGWHTRVARVRPHIVVLDMTADANPGQGITTSQSLANAYTMIDAIRANNPSVPIFMFKANHMRADAAQFASVLSYYANYATIQANRPNIGIIDTYTPWGDPALHPNEYDASDPIHPLYAGSSRVTIPTTVTALSSYIT